MHHSLLLCLILNVVYIANGFNCHHHGFGHGGHHHHNRAWHHNHGDTPNQNAAEVTQWYNDADKSVKNYCTATSKVQPFINYGSNGCIIRYPVTSTDVNVDVQVSNTVLKTSVTNKSDAQEIFTDVRVMPDILNFGQASWYFDDGNLYIVIPYNVPLNSEYQANCGVVNENIVNAPFLNVPSFQYRSAKN